MFKSIKNILPVIPCIGLYLLTGCNAKEEIAQLKTKEKFVVSAELLKTVLIDTVQHANALSQLTLSGRIMADEDKMVKIFPLVSGIVQDVHVQLGDAIKKGQLLASLKSVEMAGFAKDAIASEADIRTTRRHMEVTEDLYKSGLASQVELEQAKSEYEKALAEQKRSASVLNINFSSANQNYLIFSPISGFLVEKKLTNNMQVREDNSENLFTVADLSTVWAIMNVYESEIAKIKAGDDVKITTLSYPDKVFSGKIDKIYNILDPENKVMHARVKINNPDYLLKPEMFANINIKATSGESLPFVNTQTLIFDNGQYYVLVITSEDQVRIQPVEIAKKIEDRAYIQKGIEPGDRLIASRQLFLYESLK